jgi:hypothetical protein
MAHEYGHILGWQDLDPQQYPGHLMAGELEVGERRSVGDLLMAPRGVDVEVPEVSVVVPTRRLDVFGEEEPVVVGNSITAAARTRRFDGDSVSCEERGERGRWGCDWRRRVPDR